MMEAADRWQPAAASQLHWRDWGGDALVFDAVSGLTHQLTPLAAAAMAWLQESPHSRDSLVAAIAGALATAPDDDMHQAVATALQEFENRHWIEALKPAR